MRVFITGIAGVLGSNLAMSLIEQGYLVSGNDVCRKEEAWRLSEIIDRITYYWKATEDLLREEINSDVIIDAGLGVADRPLGNLSPEYTVKNNIFPALKLLELCRRMKKPPILVYASSFNSLYGKVNTTYTERTPVAPASVYGWTKGAVEELYLTYYRAFNIPVVITRVGSAYGPKMRSDELIAKVILYAFKDRVFKLRSPKAKRLWTYAKDVSTFYLKMLEGIEDCIGETLICAGNRGDKIVTNIELLKIIGKVIGKKIEFVEEEYEPGELINGKPISFRVNAEYSRNKLEWYPFYTLEKGIKETAVWFEENIWRYT